jgi:protein gp37
MADKSAIEWTDATWNPVLGCDKISPGCKNCYAIRTAWRLQHNPNPKVAKAFEGLTVIQGGQPNWTGRVNFVPERLHQPLDWHKPKMIFVNSQSDLFHDNVTIPQVLSVFETMAFAKQHTFQVLTKRIERAKYLLSYGEKMAVESAEHHRLICTMPLDNVWLGVSVEAPKYKYRIDILRDTPAKVRFLSLEPLLEDLGTIDLRGIHWVIVGGESGPNARPMHPDWARSLRDQCRAAGVPFFFKQWGEWAPTKAQPVRGEYTGGGLFMLPNGNLGNQGDWWDGHAEAIDKVGKKAAGRLLDGVEHSEYPA